MGVVSKDVLFLLLCLVLLHQSHSKCQESYSCRNFTLRFPFTDIRDPECGLFAVDGCDSSTREEHPWFHIGASTSAKYIINQPTKNKFTVTDFLLQSLLESPKCYSFMNMSLPQAPSVSFTFTPNITFFGCYNRSSNDEIQEYFQHYRREECEASTLYYKIPAAESHDGAIPRYCSLTQLPAKSDVNSTQMSEMLASSFSLEWSVTEDCDRCYRGGGRCLADNKNQFYCEITGPTRLRKIFFIGGITIGSLTSSLIVVLLFIRRRRAKAKQDRDRDIELFLKDNGNLVPMRYKYSSIKRMTNSFTENLGRGGFGSVYKGQFPDGRLMAVKVLNESNGDGEEFMNEVASISRTSHVNIVALLGFCFEGSKRALIYDFMPNGSLEKFIGNNASSSQESGLGWDKLFEITLGIARGLEYLHQGCNTRILHLDIKPQNILLDKDMNPRISDFGLAKLCPNRSSIVSMMGTRGTIGYIAPEVFSRNFGDVSYKSDVYSYGMLVLEMVGGRTTVDRRDVDCTSEVYFPTYLYKQIEMNAERDGDLARALDEEEERQRVKRNLIIVGLWCIQTNPRDRPSMTRVVEMLEGKFGSLEVPPKPYLCSSPRAAPTYSTSESL
ncbi:hypothetical protein SASPL_151402 [Salvia splendens]|uniref:Protein kinase domain-containing protein n=2 Tax=Salvia splendens TaxID=180675 RepID=A0A8X8Z3P1_SALSN|nr:hypothetical protein SASPL_151402 [Salvia splendens]